MRLDLLLRNANVRTLDRRTPTTRSVGMWQGRVVCLGDEAEELPAHRVVDLDGATVVPGFHDAHNHMAAYGFSVNELDLSGCTTPEDVYATVATRARSMPRDGWVLGRRYDDERVGGHPDIAKLDRASNGRPVRLEHISGHLSVVNSAALELMGVTADTPDPVGGRIVRDAAGRPTGRIEEMAQVLFFELLRPRSLEELAGAIGAAAAVYVREGLTSCVEAGVGGAAFGQTGVEAAAYLLARERGELPVRVQLMAFADALHAVPSHSVDDFRATLDLGIRTGFGDDRLSVGAMKILFDGSLFGRTAAVSQPFAGSSGSGYLQEDEAALTEKVLNAHAAGWQVAAHAIGDAAIDLFLDAVEEAERRVPRSARHRIEHCAVVRPDQVSRIAELGVVAVPQHRFIAEGADRMRAALGEARVAWTYRFRSLMEAGVPVAGSSDRPVADGNPLLGIQAMVERIGPDGRPFAPEESVDAETALRAYTQGSAVAAHREDRLGTIAPHHLGDVVVLDDDPLQVPTSRIGAINVLSTIVGGEVVYEAGS